MVRHWRGNLSLDARYSEVKATREDVAADLLMESPRNRTMPGARARKTLAEMRKCPGCEALKPADVEYSDLRADTNWTLYAFTEGRVDPTF
jgi:hypothetical protein